MCIRDRVYSEEKRGNGLDCQLVRLTRPTRNDKITSTGKHLETYRKSEFLNDSFLGIFRLKYQEDILLEQEDVPIGCGEHQSLVTGNLQDINFTISLGFPKTWLRLVG